MSLQQQACKTGNVSRHQIGLCNADGDTSALPRLQQMLMLIPALCSLSSAELEYACSTKRNSPQAVQAWRHLETFGQLVDALPKARALEVSVQGFIASQWIASDTLLLQKPILTNLDYLLFMPDS